MNTFKTFSPCNAAAVLLFVLLLLNEAGPSSGHLFMRSPVPRGGLGGVRQWLPTVFDWRAPQDLKLHFPAGYKGPGAGGALRSQIEAAGGRRWEPFRPTLASYHWRYGVCGDLKSEANQPHLKGGRYYYGGKIVKYYREAQTIDIEVAALFHHGGFLIYHVCDVSRCENRKLSEECFKKPGVCRLLRRAVVPECEDNNSERCGPIDRNHPERWYLPCSQKQGDGTFDVYGSGGTIKYELPQGFSCRHCVLHQHYGSGDRCNPNDYGAYFNGPDAPNWKSCPIEGFPVDGKHGVYNPKELACGVGKRYSEDYAHCADITIVATTH